MNAPATARAPASIISPEWRRVLLSLGAGLLVLGGVFNEEIAAAIRTWIDSTAYNHCFLVIPIALYLLWDRRFDLHGVPLQPWKPAMLPAVPVALVWLLAERLGIMEGRQLAAMTFVELLFLAVLGRRLWWAMAGPLLYLYFLVPFGEFLTPQLQDVTTWFVRHGLDILGVPAYIDGYVIEIPQGTFFIAEACAGLRFLIASIAFGCLYALMMYRGPVRRALFIIVSILVPIVANGFRAIGIVYLGYLLNSARAAAADHIIYGWVFFSFVILLLIVLGLPFRQDEMSTRSGSPAAMAAAPAAWRAAAAAAAGLVAVACITPALAAALAFATRSPPLTAQTIDLGPDCSVAALPGAEPGQRATCGDVVMDMRWQALSPRSTAGAVMAAWRTLCRPADGESRAEAWLNTGDGKPSAWRIIRVEDPAYALGVSVWIDGRPVRPGLAMRLRMALDSLTGSAHAPLVMTVTPAVHWEALTVTRRRIAEDELGAFLAAHRGLDQAVRAVTAVR
nr:exosortase A [uncultured Rhodopila sp.]